MPCRKATTTPGHHPGRLDGSIRDHPRPPTVTRRHRVGSASEASADREHPRGRSPRPAKIVGGVALVVGFWGLVALVLVLGAAGDLERAEELLPAARNAVSDLDVDTASALLDEARSELRDADAGLSNPLVLPFRAVPLVGADLRAVSAVAAGGASVGDALGETMATIDDLPGGVEALAPTDGVFPVAEIRRLSEPLRGAADATAEARRDIARQPGSGRVARVTEGRARILELLEPLETQLEAAAQLSGELPAFLGADGPRTYLFGASTPAELRGTGGFIGSVSILRVDEGSLEFGAFEAATNLPVLAPDALPPPVTADARRWGRYGGTGHWLTLNRTAHFPAAAEAMIQHWEATRGAAVDGIIVVDPFALEVLLGFTGPTEIPGYDVRLDADSVVDFVTHDAYSLFDDEDERKAVLGAVSAATLGRFLESDRDATTTAELIAGFGKLGPGGHILVHTVDGDVQEAFSRLGLTGALGEPSGDLVNVVVNSGSVSKIDYYAERRIDHEATLLQDGSVRSTMTVALSNDAPTAGPPPYIIGPERDILAPGSSLSDVSVYLAKGAVFDEVPPSRAGLPSYTETELEHPVHDGWVRLRSEESVERVYTWRTPGAWTTSTDGVVEYDLLFQGQTVIRPTQLTLRINVPAGFEVLDPPEAARIEDGAVIWSGAVRGEDIALRIRLRPLRDT